MTPPTAVPTKPIANELATGATIEDVLTAFHCVRASIAQLFEAVGADPTKTRESARALGLNRGLAWRLTRVVRFEGDPAAVSDVPGQQSMLRFLEACREQGAPEPRIAAAAEAVAAYESAVGSCAGDRKTLAMLMANRPAHDTSGEQERARRKLFEGACAVWGVQASVRFVTVFVFPSREDPDQLSAGHVTGYVSLRRLVSRPWPMSYEAVHDSEGRPTPFVKEPLDPTGSGEGELQLLKAFCTPAKPRIEVHQSGGFKRFDLAAGPVGNEGMTTCVFGSYLKDLYPRYSDTPNTAGFMVLQQTPVERLVFDMFVHRDLGLTAPPDAVLLDRLTFPHGADEAEFPRQALPMSERPATLTASLDGALCPSIPWYPRLLGAVTERVGHPIEAFTGSRFEMAYPPISTVLSRRFPIFPKP